MCHKFARGTASIVGVQLCLLLVTSMTLMRMGRLGSLELAAGSLGNLCFNVFGQMLCGAPMFVLDEFAPQAWGAGFHAEVGTLCQRALLCSFSLMAVCMLAWPWAASILVALGQPQTVSILAARYLHLSIGALPLMAVFQAMQRYCYAQGVQWPPLVAACIGTASQLVWQELLVGSLGFEGGPLSLTLTLLTMNTTLFALLRVYRPTDPRAWPGWLACTCSTRNPPSISNCTEGTAHPRTLPPASKTPPSARPLEHDTPHATRPAPSRAQGCWVQPRLHATAARCGGSWRRSLRL